MGGAGAVAGAGALGGAGCGETGCSGWTWATLGWLPKRLPKKYNSATTATIVVRIAEPTIHIAP